MKRTGLLALVLTLATCAGAQKDAKIVEQSFATCAEADGKLLDANSAALVAEILQVLTAAAADWEAELDVIAVRAGDATVACAIDAIESVLGGGSAVKVAPDGALERARAYRAKLSARMEAR